MISRKQFGIFVCMSLCTCSSMVSAQEANDSQINRPERHFKPMPLSPEKIARRTTARMDTMLHLTSKQHDKLYKLNLKWAREDANNGTARPHMDGNRPNGRPNGRLGSGGPGFGGLGSGTPNGGPGFGGDQGFTHGQHRNRPPEGINGRPPRDFPQTSNRTVDREKQRIAREKKIKKILTDEQYTLWTEQQHRAPTKNQDNQ